MAVAPEFQRECLAILVGIDIVLRRTAVIVRWRDHNQRVDVTERYHLVKHTTQHPVLHGQVGRSRTVVAMNEVEHVVSPFRVGVVAVW